MGSMSIWHWLVVLVVVLLLFGGSSKISSLMGDFAKGIKAFKKNMAEDEPVDSATKNSAKSLPQSEKIDESVSFNEKKENVTTPPDINK